MESFWKPGRPRWVRPLSRSLSRFEWKTMIRRRFSTLPVPIQKCTSDIRVHVHGNAARVCATLLSPSRGIAWGYGTAARFADADAGLRAVAGSDPSLRGAWYGHGDGWDVHGHPNPAPGSLPVQQSLAGRPSKLKEPAGPIPQNGQPQRRAATSTPWRSGSAPSRPRSSSVCLPAGPPLA